MVRSDVVASFSFLHAADIHLDSPLRGLSRYDGVPAVEVRGATRAAFDRLIETAIEREVDFVVLAGDLYDGDWKDMGTGLYFSAAMGLLGRAGIPVYLLAGNHDAASVITKALPPLENVHTFATKKPTTHRLPHLSVAVHGRSFGDREVFENLAAGYPDPDRDPCNNAGSGVLFSRGRDRPAISVVAGTRRSDRSAIALPAS